MNQQKGLRSTLILVSLVMILTLTSCSSESISLKIGDDYTSVETESDEEVADRLEKQAGDVYDTVFEKYGDPSTRPSKSATEYGVGLVNSIYSEGKKAAPYIALGSFGIGFFIFLFARGNKRIRKFGVFGLMIGVPVVLIILVYGFGYVKHLFLG